MGGCDWLLDICQQPVRGLSSFTTVAPKTAGEPCMCASQPHVLKPIITAGGFKPTAITNLTAAAEAHQMAATPPW